MNTFVAAGLANVPFRTATVTVQSRDRQGAGHMYSLTLASHISSLTRAALCLPNRDRQGAGHIHSLTVVVRFYLRTSSPRGRLVVG